MLNLCLFMIISNTHPSVFIDDKKVIAACGYQVDTLTFSTFKIKLKHFEFKVSRIFQTFSHIIVTLSFMIGIYCIFVEKPFCALVKGMERYNLGAPPRV